MTGLFLWGIDISNSLYEGILRLNKKISYCLFHKVQSENNFPSSQLKSTTIRTLSMTLCTNFIQGNMTDGRQSIHGL